jgi:hypothetical protein
VDPGGNVYITGYFEGTADFDPGAGTYNLTSAGSWDIFISKLNASGNFVYAKQLGGNDWNEGPSIVVDPGGNVYTTGNFEGTVDFDPGAGTYNLTSAGSKDIFVHKMSQGPGSVPEQSVMANLNVFPNPATSFVTIHIKEGIQIEEAIIYNHLGQKALVAVPVNNTVDVSGLKPGIYFIEVITSESRAGTKLVIE